METTGMTYGEALIDPTTVLYKADRLLAAQRKQRTMTPETLTWFGGYVGVRWNADRRLHLLADDRVTFCHISTGLRRATIRNADAPDGWCETCLNRAQDARRDLPAKA